MCKMKTLKVPSSVWDPLATDEKAYIKGILVGSKAINHDCEIVGDPTLEQTNGLIPGIPLPGIDDAVKIACQIACDAAATAIAACAGISNGIAAAACIAVAEAAREECKKHC